jgi:hypothetical protein
LGREKQAWFLFALLFIYMVEVCFMVVDDLLRKTGA